LAIHTLKLHLAIHTLNLLLFDHPYTKTPLVRPCIYQLPVQTAILLTCLCASCESANAAANPSPSDHPVSSPLADGRSTRSPRALSVYVYMLVRWYIYIYVVCVYIYIYMHKNTLLTFGRWQIYTLAVSSECIRIYVCWFVYICVCVCIYIYMHIYMHIYTYICKKIRS
jgi:hypothetical protein